MFTKAREFPKHFKWLNTDKPLSLEMLRGHIVLLDFWTYCCINCMHVLPDLKWLENRYREKPFIVIGVHSAKFDNEQNPENIREAIDRCEIEHPIIIDENMTIWRNYGVQGWPTITVVDPKGNIMYQQSGERQREDLEDVIQVLLARGEAQATLVKPLQISRPKVEHQSTLRYPGKISFAPDGNMFAVSDSNHNRILLIYVNGKIRHVIGSGEEGLGDGKLDNAKFFRPQGVLWHDSKIYVADTENHALRQIDLEDNSVRTVAGTGKQGHWLEEGRGASVMLSSPWDLALKDDRLFIAMAGAHQIWYYDIKEQGIRHYAGSGHENIVDGQLKKAQFAQPSGLSIDDKFLYVADSEVSGIRKVDLEKGVVETVAGAGLFVFGHEDGELSKARFQHPLGISAVNGSIYVADTYNNAIRVIDAKQQSVATLVGKPGMKTMCRIDDKECDTLGLYEPNDVKLQGNNLFIADTNNHLIRTFDLGKMVLKTFKISE
jgi:thiol-disulfide isomerase/thioredoxin